MTLAYLEAKKSERESIVLQTYCPKYLALKASEDPENEKIYEGKMKEVMEKIAIYKGEERALKYEKDFYSTLEDRHTAKKLRDEIKEKGCEYEKLLKIFDEKPNCLSTEQVIDILNNKLGSVPHSEDHCTDCEYNPLKDVLFSVKKARELLTR